MESLGEVFNRNRALREMLDWELMTSTSERIYLKVMALNTVIDFVSRTMSTMQVKIRDETGKIDKNWDYILNVRPNKDMSAGDFWQAFFYKLLDDNEVLVVLSQDNQLLIADDFVRTEWALYEDTFEKVTVKDYTFNRRFQMKEVIYLRYNNDSLERFTKGLFDDYAELFGRIVEVSMRNNQIRGTVKVNHTGTVSGEKDKNGKTINEKLQDYINKIYKSFRTSSVAVVPELNGFEYNEFTNKTGVTNQSLDELDSLKVSLMSDVARAIGVPPALIKGEMADLQYNLDAYRELCIKPLTKKMTDELTKAFIHKNDYDKGKTLTVQNVLPRDPLKLATQIDKIISSGTLTPNETRALFEFEAVDDPAMNRYYLTKNYDTLKGGEEANDEGTSN
nr:phage portal protein [Atopobacter phocae]